MKIATLAAASMAFIHLKGPDGSLLYDGKEKVGIDLYGPGSPEHAQVGERQNARTVRRLQANDNKVSVIPADEARADAAADLATMTAAFHHIEHDGPDGQPLSGIALYTAVYSDPTLGWIRDQASKAVGDWSRFTKGSATS